MDKKSVAKNYRFMAIMIGSMILGAIVGWIWPAFGNKISFLGTVFIKHDVLYRGASGVRVHLRRRGQYGKPQACR